MCLTNILTVLLVITVASTLLTAALYCGERNESAETETERHGWALLGALAVTPIAMPVLWAAYTVLWAALG